MTRAAKAVAICLLLTGCSDTAESIFRPDFGQPTQSAYTPPSASARAQAARNAAQGDQEIRTQSSKVRLAPPDVRSHSTPSGTVDVQRQPRPATTPPPSSSVGGHYQQQLDLHKGDTTPGYRPPRQRPKERSWIDSLFGADDPPPSKAAPNNCYIGQLTGEGVTCQAMRTDDGRLLTLGGPLRGFGPGDRVCVCGPVAEISFCQQGTTVYVAKIDVRCTSR
ncbi:MAG TPA: hypothetical protein DCS82_02385 [Rhodospirillaceae bacterium]|nr:hypothetical protein [Rhodospirillaceae bacterium]